jgi:uncharacterized membrane protein YbjE (DUF340 family)
MSQKEYFRDHMRDLPTDNSLPSEQERRIIETFFRENPSAVTVVASEVKECIIIIILFMLFSSQQVTDLIEKFVPITSRSTLFMTLIKCAMILVLYYFAKNFQLIRKN